jgi:uncharacterized protein with NRDE domain
VCTAVILAGAHPAWPVVVAANRDEFYARPARGPVALLPHAVGGLDQQKGGSWMGATAGGFLALLTNQPEPVAPPAGVSSRGELVLEALRRGGGPGGRTAVRSWLGELEPRRYSSFNLVYGDSDGLEVAYGRNAAPAVELEPVPAGIHIVPNGRLDQPGHRKVARARELAAPAVASARDWPALAAALGHLLADHDRPALEDIPDPGPGARFPREVLRELHAICIHTPLYGTRSASITALAPGRTAALLWAAGPPCTTPFAPALP